MRRIALAQTTSTDDFNANLKHALGLVGTAAQQGATLLAFPEVFLFIGGRQGKLVNAVSLEGDVIAQFKEQAQKHNMLLLLGSVHERIEGNDDKVYNTSILMDEQGKVLAVYRKLKLFDVDLPDLRIRESDTIMAGSVPPPVVETSLGRIGLTLCFDLRFASLYRHLRQQNAELVFAPSSFTFPTGAAHWEVLLRARALENQYYVAAPAQVGVHSPKFTSYGHSALVDPWGDVVAMAKHQTGLVFAEIDLNYLQQVRRKLPVEAWMD